jgi:hypothetical protein
MSTDEEPELRRVILIVVLGFAVGMGYLLYIVSSGL